MVLARCDNGVKARCALRWERTLIPQGRARSDETTRSTFFLILVYSTAPRGALGILPVQRPTGPDSGA